MAQLLKMVWPGSSVDQHRQSEQEYPGSIPDKGQDIYSCTNGLILLRFIYCLMQTYNLEKIKMAPSTRRTEIHCGNSFIAEPEEIGPNS